MSFALTLPDGSKKEFDKAVSVKDVASSIATSLGKAAVGAKVNGQVKPLDYEIDSDVEIAILTDKDEEGLDILRATAAFALEAVAKKKYPELRLGEHVADEGGFYVDTDKKDQIKVTELPELEKAMEKLVKSGQAIAWNFSFNFETPNHLLGCFSRGYSSIYVDVLRPLELR